MKNHVNMAYLLIGAVVVVACILTYFYTNQAYILMNCSIGIFFIIGAFTTPPEDIEGRSRDSAQTLSLFPGIGHFYIGAYKRGIIFLSGLVIAIFIFMSIYFVDLKYATLSVTTSLTYVASLIIWSMIDVAIICDNYGIDGGGSMVFYINNPKKTEFLLSSIMGIIAIALIIGASIGENLLVLGIIASMPYLIFTLIKFRAYKNR